MMARDSHARRARIGNADGVNEPGVSGIFHHALGHVWRACGVAAEHATRSISSQRPYRTVGYGPAQIEHRRGVGRPGGARQTMKNLSGVSVPSAPHDGKAGPACRTDVWSAWVVRCSPPDVYPKGVTRAGRGSSSDVIASLDLAIFDGRGQRGAQRPGRSG